jgi:hypothetical protein
MSQQASITAIPVGLDIMSLYPSVLVTDERTIDRIPHKYGLKVERVREVIRQLKDMLPNEQKTPFS